jgi:putative RNA 2'-phosphotransferase
VDVVRLSKRLSYVLRHHPDSVGLSLDAAGWADVDQLLTALGWTRAQLGEVVARNDKQRFALDETGTRIRANQGHSVAVELGYPPATPPDVLFHGTVDRFLPAIREQGLRPAGRHAVQLSLDAGTARRAGGRRGRPVVLQVDAAGMARDGAVFTRSANDVWLVDAVPPRYLSGT